MLHNIYIYLILIMIFRYGKMYIKAAKSIMKKGAGYTNTEIQRLDGILQKVIILQIIFHNIFILNSFFPELFEY